MFFIFLSTIILVFASAVFSASETAITGSSPGKMHRLKSEGDSRANLVTELLKNKGKLISTLLVANNIVNILSTSIVTSAFIKFYGEQGTVYATLVMSISLIVFAEVLPKTFAVMHPEKFALIAAPFLNFLVLLLTPLTILLNLVIKFSIRLLNFSKDQIISGTEEVRGVIEHQLEEGNVFKSDRDMLGGVLDLSSMTVGDIMLHRSNMQTIDGNLSLKEITDQALKIPYTRIPIWKNEKDNIIGVLHIRTLMKALYENKFEFEKVNFEGLLTEPWFIPDNVQVNIQLTAFRKKRSHFALVVDEYGNVEGAVTLEDIIEEIVGQIEDEYDSNDELIIKQTDDKGYIIAGISSIRDINRELGWNLPNEYSSTFAGLIMHETGRIPDEGETVQILKFSITILEKKSNSIKSVLVKIDSSNSDAG